MPIVDVQRRQPLSGCVWNQEIHLCGGNEEQLRQTIGTERVANMQADAAEAHWQVPQTPSGRGAWSEIGAVNRGDRSGCHNVGAIRRRNGSDGTGRRKALV